MLIVVVCMMFGILYFMLEREDNKCKVVFMEESGFNEKLIYFDEKLFYFDKKRVIMEKE